MLRSRHYEQLIGNSYMSRANKMVTTPEKNFRTPPTSRGTSPSRVANNNKRNSPNATPNKSKISSVRGILKKGESPDRRRKPTPERIVNGKRRGSSPAKVQEQILASRGSE